MADNLQYGKPSGRTLEYLDKYVKDPFRTSYVTCKGTVLPEYYTNFGDRIYEMNIRPDDIWVCSFPKAGTTLTQEMVWCIVNNVDLKAAELNLEERFPYLEGSAVCYWIKSLPEVDNKMFKLVNQDSVERIVNMASPRFIKTHIPFDLLPKQLQQNEGKVIYVTRNPRDTCISFYHHYRNIKGYTGNFEQFCEIFLEGNVHFGPFWKNVQSYWEARNKSNVLILRYEDIVKNMKSVIYQIAHFLEKSLSDSQVTQLLDHLSFEKSKANPAMNQQPFFDLLDGCGLLHEKHENFIRSGKVGEWEAVMDAKLEQDFEKWQQDSLRNADEALVDFFNYKK